MQAQSVKIMDRSFSLLGEIDDYESLMLTRSWTGFGSFELRINANKANAPALQKENIIFLTPHKAGVILYREISTDDNEQLIIKGHSLKTYIGRKITEPPAGAAYDYKNDFAENVIKHYVNANCVDPANPKRQVHGLTVAPSQGRGQKLQFQTRYKNLAEEIAKICEVSGLGWDVWLNFDAGEFVMDVCEGRNLTAGQDTLPPVIFSVDYDNVQGQRLTDSNINYRGTAYVGGQGEGADRAVELLGDEAEGLDRFEVFVDARDVEDDTMLADRGRQKLEDYREVFALDNDILTQTNVVYGADWDLGDVVTAVNRKWGATLDARITEVTEIYEVGGFRLNATFGTSAPTLVDKIKQELSGPLVERMDPAGLDIPTKTSELENDSGYITDADIPQAATYIHNQITPADIWTINHALGKYPAVAVVDSAGTVVVGETNYVSENTVEVSFANGFAGKAYLN